MFYTIRKFSNPQNRSEEKYYPVPKIIGRIKVRDIAQQIAKECTLSTVDVMAVLEAFLQDLPLFMMLGHSIKLSDFGTFKISFSSEGSKTPDKVTADNIKNAKVIFLPSSELKKTIANDISYSYFDNGSNTPEADEAKED